MSNIWENTISVLIACITSYLYGVSETNLWYIIKNSPSEDSRLIGTMFYIFVSCFFISRFFIEMFDWD